MIGQSNSKKLNINDLRCVIGSSKRWIYSRDEYIELLNMFICELNKNTVINPLKVVVCDESIYIRGYEPKHEKKDIEHNYDIYIEYQKVKDERVKNTEPLTENQIKAIKKLYADNYSKNEIAKVFGLSRTTVNRYCQKKN